MEGSSNMNGVNDFDDLDTWTQQVEYQDIKAQQQLTKQHYGSPTGSPTRTPPAAEDVKASLAALETAPAQDFSEMEKLSRDYQPDLQVCRLCFSLGGLGLIVLGSTCWSCKVQQGFGGGVCQR